MAREILSLEEIKKLNELLRRVFGFIADLKKSDKLAEKIKYPQVPSSLTESLALHLLNRNLILSELRGYHSNFGGNLSDLKATKGGKVLKIEVKATAKSAFQYLGEKDIRADYIVWFHFNDFYSDQLQSTIEVYTIENPRTHFKRPTKITLSKLKEIVGKKLRSTTLSKEIMNIAD
jgi:hypothetical protein